MCECVALVSARLNPFSSNFLALISSTRISAQWAKHRGLEAEQTEIQNLPIFGEIGPVPHHAATEHLLLFGVIVGRIQCLAENVIDLIAVHHSGPSWPRIAARAMSVQIHVHVQAFLGISKTINTSL